MALSIQSNMASMSIQSQLNRTNDSLSTALERLGSGFRINSAKDDAAGLQIANRLNAQVVGQKAAIYNANNANSMLQTAEGAFDEMTNISYRMKELATQAANGSNNQSEYDALDKEYTALKAELTNIMDNTTYGSGTNLFDAAVGKFTGAVDFQIGANSAETLTVDVSTEVGAVRTSVGTTLQDLAWDTDSATSVAAAQTEMDEIDNLIDNIGAARASLGASMNRLDHTINNVSNMMENTQAAASQLMDADYAAESSSMTKQQLLMNSGISVLSASNSTTQMIGSLLR